MFAFLEFQKLIYKKMALCDILFDHVSIIVIAIVACVLFIIYYYIQKHHHLPPGPWGIPILGYWPFFKSDCPDLQLQKMKDEYGEIFSVSVAGRQFIFLNSTKILKEAYINKAECFGRKFTDFSVLTYCFQDGVGMANGESWKVQRKFFHHVFKEYGMLALKGNFSNCIYEALNDTIDEIRALEGQPLVLAELLTSKCTFIIRRILFNDQGITDEELKELIKEYDSVVSYMTYKNIILIGNIAKYFIFPFMPSFWRMAQSHNRVIFILKDIIRRHKTTFDNVQMMDIIDTFYKEKHDREIKGDPSAVYLTDEALLSSVYQFLIDGILSTAFFILLFLQSIIEHPEEQEKIYEELNEIIGPERQPTIEDKSNLPYTNAFINETLRCSYFFPAFPSLECTKETTLNGYRIPKGAISVLNITAIHHDPLIYKDPFKFNPPRFLSNDGKPSANPPIMFGIGKRNCLAEPFIMNQTFLFLTTVVKNFHLTGEIGRSLSVLDGGDIKIYAHSRDKKFI